MILLPKIKAIGLSIYLEKSKTLILSDIHIGYEEALNKDGILIPRVNFNQIYSKTKCLIRDLDFDSVIINGDLKHEFGTISKTEWSHTLRFLDLFKDKKVFLIKGNHDTILGPIAEQKDIKIQDYVLIDSVLMIHGDREVDLGKIEKDNNAKIKIIIIGHEHPAITIKGKNRAETYKCYLIGKYKKRDLIVMPSYNEIREGTNILREDILSPFLKQDLDDFKVIVYGDELYDFGRLSRLR